MLLIALSWIYILFTSVSVGMVISHLFKITTNACITIFVGLFGITVFAACWALFYRINFEFHLVLLAMCSLIFVGKRHDYYTFWRLTLSEFKRLGFALKILLCINLLFILAQCSSAPFAFDNESYYIQNVKWLNEYGLVKGLANLHLFLAQTSGWTILQSVFSFSFVFDRFNDINGFALSVVNIFAFFKLSDYFEKRQFADLLIGLFPLVNLLLFPFVPAPSSDLPIYILTLLIAYYLLRDFANMQLQTFHIITILSLFAIFIKTTAFALALIPIALLLMNFRNHIRQIVPILIVSILVLGLFIAKNTILSGYPLYPLTSVRFEADFTVPAVIVEKFTLLFVEQINLPAYKNYSAFEYFLHWLTLPKLQGFFNVLSLLLLLVTPIFIIRYYHKKSIWLLYFTMSFQLVALFISAPQYRFFLNFVIVFCLFLISLILTKSHRLTMTFLVLATCFVGVFVLIPLNISSFSNNRVARSTSSFSLNTLVIPAPNSKLRLTFDNQQIGNLKYNSPRELNYIYITGDGDLPCVKKSQINYFRRKFGYFPQQRTAKLKDGFYAKSAK